MDLYNAIESLRKALKNFGVKLEILEGGDGYEEISLTRIENAIPQE